MITKYGQKTMKKKKKNIRLRDASPTNVTAIYICKHFLKDEKK